MAEVNGLIVLCSLPDPFKNDLDFVFMKQPGRRHDVSEGLRAVHLLGQEAVSASPGMITGALLPVSITES